MAIRRIATEEAFALDTQLAALKRARLDHPDDSDAAFWSMVLDGGYEDIVGGLLDLGEERVRVMDAYGIDMHVLLLTSPGVQLLDADAAASLATLANDRLAEAIARYPMRFAGLASFAPQDPMRAAKEMERAAGALKLNGFVVNSHTNGEYLDEPRYWPILEAAAALGKPLYIHPRTLPPGATAPYLSRRLTGGIWGYAAETGLHAMRLIMAGVFDRLPDLRIILGHMGEGLPYWLYRIDYMFELQQRQVRSPLEHRPSDYFKRNFAITTSGMNDADVLDFCLKKVGADNIMWAVDYPYQDSAGAVAFLEDAAIDSAAKAKIWGGNAERIFGIAPRPPERKNS
ncbi:MAG TPA: amidohydrolase family protein [Sphingomonadaceae bacterium]|nr:amidohydrolase family protein [Sphingomonadaceae bacterium]